MKNLIVDGPDTADIMFSYFEGKVVNFTIKTQGKEKKDISGVISILGAKDGDTIQMTVNVLDNRDLLIEKIHISYNPKTQGGRYMDPKEISPLFEAYVKVH